MAFVALQKTEQLRFSKTDFGKFTFLLKHHADIEDVFTNKELPLKPGPELRSKSSLETVDTHDAVDMKEEGTENAKYSKDRLSRIGYFKVHSFVKMTMFTGADIKYQYESYQINNPAFQVRNVWNMF